MKQVKLTIVAFQILWGDIEKKLSKNNAPKSQWKARYGFLKKALDETLKSNNILGELTITTLYKKSLLYKNPTEEIVLLSKSPYNTVFFRYLGYNNIQEFIESNIKRFSPEELIKQNNLSTFNISNSSKNNGYEATIQSFSSQDSFENYLRKRLLKSDGTKLADRIKVVHFSDKNIYSEGSKLKEIVSAFLSSGGSWERIISVPQNQNVHSVIEEELKIYQNQRYFLRVVEDIMMRNAGIYSFIIIDDNEVCIGGAYIDADIPTLVYRDSRVTEFYTRYYDQLCTFAIRIKHSVSETIENRTSRLEKWEKFKLASDHLTDYFIKEFESDDAFNNYIEHRYKSVGTVKIIAFSNASDASIKDQDKRFDIILKNWLNDDTKKCIHINSKRNELGKKKLLRRAERSLKAGTDHSFYYLNQAAFGNDLGHFEMILDNKEVYFRNSKDAKNSKSVSIIGTNHPEIVKIWSERFNNLRIQSKILKSGIHYLDPKALRDDIMIQFEDENNFYKDLQDRLEELHKSENDTVHNIYSISFINELKDNETFENIRNEFLSNGNQFHSIRGRKPNKNIDNIIQKLQRYSDYKNYYYYLKQVEYGDLQGLSVIILDDKIVYFQNGKGIPGNTIIACNHEYLISFWKNRFDYLKSKAIVIKSETSDLNIQGLTNK